MQYHSQHIYLLLLHKAELLDVEFFLYKYKICINFCRSDNTWFSRTLQKMLTLILKKCTKFAKFVLHFVQPPRMRISCAFSFASCLIKATICAENFMTSNTGISYGEAGTGLKLQKTSKLEIVNRKLG